MLETDNASLNLLIAEDHSLIRELLGSLMDSWGYRADIVTNGLEAVQHAQVGTYDVCLMDRRMPVMDGFTAIENIRRQTPYFPILMYSLDLPPSPSFIDDKGIDE